MSSFAPDDSDRAVSAVQANGAVRNEFRRILPDEEVTTMSKRKKRPYIYLVLDDAGDVIDSAITPEQLVERLRSHIEDGSVSCKEHAPLAHDQLPNEQALRAYMLGTYDSHVREHCRNFKMFTPEGIASTVGWITANESVVLVKTEKAV